MPAAGWIVGGVLAALGIGAAGGYIAGVKTSHILTGGAVLAGGYYLMRGRK